MKKRDDDKGETAEFRRFKQLTKALLGVPKGEAMGKEKHGQRPKAKRKSA